MDKLNRNRTLRIRISDEEWEWLKTQKEFSGRSYNMTIRKLINNHFKTPF